MLHIYRRLCNTMLLLQCGEYTFDQIDENERRKERTSEETETFLYLIHSEQYRIDAARRASQKRDWKRTTNRADDTTTITDEGSADLDPATAAIRAAQSAERAVLGALVTGARSRRELCRQIRSIRRKMISDAISRLLVRRLIVETKVKTKGRPKHAYRLANRPV
jgi:hypothetical protein